MSATSIYNSCDNILAGSYPSPVSPVYQCAMSRHMIPNTSVNYIMQPSTIRSTL